MSIEKVRAEISGVDREIIRLIAKRQQLAEKIVAIKIQKGLPVHDEVRTAKVLDMVFDQAVECKIDPVAVQEIFRRLIAMSEERQREYSGEGNLP
ncbi:MAG: chorismate mutase [Methanomicrobiales archaeon]|nr:chorismate mutase [Methanomicrobiales archaeon]